MYDEFVMMSEDEPVEGGYNDPPPNFREATAAEISRSDLFTYTPRFHFYRQIDPKRLPWDEKYFLSVHFYGMSDGTGYGIASDWHKRKIRWFRYGCGHDYVEKGTDWCKDREIVHYGSCYHVYECSKCKHIKSEDSSG